MAYADPRTGSGTAGALSRWRPGRGGARRPSRAPGHGSFRAPRLTPGHRRSLRRVGAGRYATRATSAARAVGVDDRGEAGVAAGRRHLSARLPDANTFVIFDGGVTVLLVAAYVSMLGWTAPRPHRWSAPARRCDRAEPPTDDGDPVPLGTDRGAGCGGWIRINPRAGRTTCGDPRRPRCPTRRPRLGEPTHAHRVRRRRHRRSRRARADDPGSVVNRGPRLLGEQVPTRRMTRRS